jgi:cytochrome c
MRKFLVFLLLLTGSGSALAGDAAEGRKIVTAECSRCHATGKTGKSPNPLSPPFRDVVKRYSPDSLIEALGEGITTGHNEMPEFMFEPEDIMKIVAYLKTLN